MIYNFVELLYRFLQINCEAVSHIWNRIISSENSFIDILQESDLFDLSLLSEAKNSKEYNEKKNGKNDKDLLIL